MSKEFNTHQEILLDIGHATRSVAEYSEFDFTNGRHYIGLELPTTHAAYDDVHGEFTQEKLESYRRHVKEKREGENIQFVSGDARHMPLKSSSVDTVFMANVVDGSPLTDDNFDKLMVSVREVLKDDGRLIFLEDRSPYGQENPNYQLKLRQLELLGFTVEETIKGNDERFEDLRKKYGMQSQGGSALADPEFRKALAGRGKDWRSYKPLPEKAYDNDHFIILKKTTDPPIFTHKNGVNTRIAAQFERIGSQVAGGLDGKQIQGEGVRVERRKQKMAATGKLVGRSALKVTGRLRKKHKT